MSAQVQCGESIIVSSTMTKRFLFAITPLLKRLLSQYSQDKVPSYSSQPEAPACNSSSSTSMAAAQLCGAVPRVPFFLPSVLLRTTLCLSASGEN